LAATSLFGQASATVPAASAAAEKSTSQVPSLNETAPNEPTGLRAFVEQYYSAYAKKDLDAAMAQWSSQSPDLATQRQAAQQFFAANDKITVAVASVGAPAVENDKVKFRVALAMNAIDAKSQQPTPGLDAQVHEFECVREQNSWKIWKEID